MSVIGRLAPSPTGLLHLGHARTFLLAYWSARAQNGRLLLRLEDLDGERSKPEFLTAAERDLEWLGLDWDGVASVQSDGLERLFAAAHGLLERGLAYACTCTRHELRESQGAPQLGVSEPRYLGTCRGRYAGLADAGRASGRRAGIRLLVPEGVTHFEDELCGAQAFDVQAEIGDFLIARRDGVPSYQLAVVVDDAAQGVSEVVRGDDLLPSTARQWLLQRALELPHPRWAHVPLVVDEQGRRLAKRAGDLGLAELRARGVDPRRIVAWAARSAGFSLGERATARELVPEFSWARVRRRPVVLSAADLGMLQP
jgi:glutamyl-tRNA synthetase